MQTNILSLLLSSLLNIPRTEYRSHCLLILQSCSKKFINLTYCIYSYFDSPQIAIILCEGLNIFPLKSIRLVIWSYKLEAQHIY